MKAAMFDSFPAAFDVDLRDNCCLFFIISC